VTHASGLVPIPPPNHLGVVERAINNSIQERWPSGDPFVRHAFFGKYSASSPMISATMGIDEGPVSMEYCGTFAGNPPEMPS
jgi:hypothetical protein